MPDANTYLPPVKVIPGALLITNITQANPCVITITDSDLNTYIVNQVVHLTVPSSYGMSQINQLSGQILAIDGTDFTVSIDTTLFDAFVTPSVYQSQPASLSPGGSRNLQYDNNTNQVAFQNLNNIGN